MSLPMPQKQKFLHVPMPIRSLTVAAEIAALLFALACNSGSNSNKKISEQKSGQFGKNVTAANSTSGPGIVLDCVYDHLQNPPESFHYLYKKDATNPVHQEADVTPQTIDGFR